MIDNLKPYPDYRDSGVPWLGRIPSHWGVVRSKRMFSARNELARPTDVQLSATQAYGVIPQAEFEAKVGRRVVKISMHLEKRRHVEKDDFVISMRSFQGGLERAWATGCIRSSYVVLKPVTELDADFFAYLFKAPRYIRALQSTADFVRDGQDLTFRDFSAVDLPVPPQTEQQSIARVLGHAGNRIRRYVTTRREVIALLNDQKQAVADHLISNGLGGTTPRVESGMVWLGDVPRHWKVRRLKTIIRPVDIRSTTGSETLLSLRRNHGIVVFAEHFSRPPQGASMVGFKLVEPNGLVVNRLQANNGLVFCSRLRGLVSPDYSVFEAAAPVNMEFIATLLRTSPYRTHFRRESTGLGTGSSGFLRLYDDRLLETPVALPPLAEQEAMLSELASRTESLQRTVERQTAQLALIGEFRSRLVADIVTGQLDARGAAHTLFEGSEGSVPLVADDVDSNSAEVSDLDAEAE